jgi:stage II sporulation protein AA (anti-sigma F factor antagonist)
MNANSLSIVESRNGDICVVTLSGRIDSTNADDLIARLKKLILAGEKSIIADLGAVLFLTSVAFRAFLVITDEAERNSAKFVLCNVLGSVRELFELGGLIDAFTIYGSREEASTKLG